jgi:arylsulfatase A-like enzyme
MAGSPTVTRRQWLATAAGALARRKRPNIILIVADDLGFSDLGCYGGEIETPNLDRLASQGVRFTQFYNCARCCPTRASLLTGLYPHQAGIGYMEPTHKYARGAIERKIPQYQGFLNRECVTLAEALKPAGYQSFLSGKWHVGREPGQMPLDRGFDRFFGILGGMVAYFDPPPEQLYEGREPLKRLPPKFYATDAFTDKAIQFMKEADPARPYFLYLAYTSPHFNLDAWPEDIRKYRGKYMVGWDETRRRRFERQLKLGIVAPGAQLSERHPRSPAWEDEPDKDLMDLKMAVYAAAVDRMDWNIGRLLEALRRSRAEDNTLVIFISDNGGEMLGRRLNSKPPYSKKDHAMYLLPWANVSNTPFRLFKQMMHEGGISSPFIARWPGVTPPGSLLRRDFGHVMDLMPTFLEIAGATYPSRYNGRRIPPVEGMSLLAMLHGREGGKRRTLFWEHGGNRALRDGRWKLVSFYNEVEEDPVTFGLGARTGAWELYDMEKDRSECSDLARAHPERVRAMERQYEQWARRCGVVPWEEILRDGGWLPR